MRFWIRLVRRRESEEERRGEEGGGNERGMYFENKKHNTDASLPLHLDEHAAISWPFLLLVVVVFVCDEDVIVFFVVPVTPSQS